MRVQLGFLKVQINVRELLQAVEALRSSRAKVFDALTTELRSSASAALDHLLHAEMTLFLGQPDQVDNRRNGYETKDYALKGIGALRIRVPIDRKRRFDSSLIPKGERMDPRLKEDMAALQLAGLSSRTLALMSKRILGIDVSHQTVAASMPMISSHAEDWLRRPISGEWWALLIDGTYFNVVRRGSVEKEPSLVVLGIDSMNRRSILAIEPGHRDNADSWRTVFREMKARGLNGSCVRLGIMDGLPGLESVFREEFPVSVTARCWFHAMANALNKAPKRLRDAFHKLAKRIMYADGIDGARTAFVELKEAMGRDAQGSVACLEKDLESLISHYKFPPKLWISLKTTNAVERIHKEFKRRSKAMERMGETTLRTLQAFTAMRLEMKWKRPLDTYPMAQLIKNSSIPAGALGASGLEGILH
jgi:putative transposase